MIATFNVASASRSHHEDRELQVSSNCTVENCLNNGTCRGNRCMCAQNYIGFKCEQYNYCGSNPCKDREACLNTKDSYQCVCQLGFKGEDCSTFVGCEPNPCENGATCSVAEHMDRKIVFCNCKHGFFGRTCSIKL